MYFLAIDIGATSGKAILGKKINNELHTKVIHRFPNKLKNVNNQLCWDYDELFSNIVKSLKVCKRNNTIPETLSIDTWGVDFVLLDNKNKVLGNTVSYRDTRTFKSKKIFII